MPNPDPRGVKVEAQNFKVYKAQKADDSNCFDPALVDHWHEITSARFESLQGNSGLAPNVCLLTEIKAPASGTTKSQGSPPAFTTENTGDGTTGTLFCGADIDNNYLVKVECSKIGSPTDFAPIFIGVVVKAAYDLNTGLLQWTCEDYRHFMRKLPLYGRYIFNPYAVGGGPAFIRGFRTTFNEGGKPDRIQVGTTLDPAGTDSTTWVDPYYNRADGTVPGGPADVGMSVSWADYWLAGHVWNYLVNMYCAAAPLASEIAHLNLYGMINIPYVTNDPDDPLYLLFENNVSGRVMVGDLAVTGMSIDKLISLLLQKAGSYDWTLVPNADGKTLDLVVFNTHSSDPAEYGLGSLDYTWGDYGQTVYAAQPEVEGGKIIRDETEFYNRGYAVSRRKLVETSLTTVADYFAASTPASLAMDALAGDVTAYLAAKAAGSADARKENFYGAVYRRYRVPLNYDWGAYVFNNQKVHVGHRPALRKLTTLGWSAATAYEAAPAFRRMDTQVWRSTDGGHTWEPKPDYVGVEILPDNCGILLSASAREGKNQDGKRPWTWNGDPASPVVYDLMVTLCVEADEPLDYEKDNSGSERARECFLDCGNTFRSCHRINAVLPTNGSGKPTTNKPAGEDTFGSPGSPDTFIDESAALQAELEYMMYRKSATFIQGSIPIWGLRIDPWPIGYLLGELQVTAGTPKRSTMVLNACIRGFRMERDTQTTTYTLDGR